MRVLQVGGGSMGTRRMRDLHGRTDLGEPVEVRLMDQRADRRATAHTRFGLETFGDLESALEWAPDAMVVSTPPDQHADLVRLAVQQGCHVFSEADIWAAEPALAETAAAHGTVVAPSATLLFQGVVREVARVVGDELGRLHAFGYVLSVDAPSWHPGEGDEYYARHRATAPAREMTAFELIALQAVVGHATAVSGVVSRRGSLDSDAEDTYTLQYETERGAAGQLAVVMASPQVVRRGWVVGDNGFVAFDLLAGTVERRLPALGVDDVRVIADWSATLETVYHEEISTFVAAARSDQSRWPYSLADSVRVCATLAAAERSAHSGRAEAVRTDVMPARLPGDGHPVDPPR